MDLIEVPGWVIVAAPLLGAALGGVGVWAWMSPYNKPKTKAAQPPLLTPTVKPLQDVLMERIKADPLPKVEPKAEVVKVEVAPAKVEQPKKTEIPKAKAVNLQTKTFSPSPKRSSPFKHKPKEVEPEDVNLTPEGDIIPVRITKEQHTFLMSKIASREMYKSSDAAKLLQVSVNVIYRRIHDGKMKATTIEHEYWIKPIELLKWVTV